MSESFIPLFTPDINEEDIEKVAKVLRSGMLVQGKNVEALEAFICNYIGCKHAIVVSNGTATLHLMLYALGIGKTHEVIVPALSYIATANVVELVGAKPVFVDVERNSFNMDPNLLEKAITENTRAIMPVHEFGLPANLNAIKEIAAKYNIPVIEDAACAIGSTLNSEQTGKNSYLASFSLHPRKAVTSGEGGIIVTNHDNLAANLRMLRNHGLEMQNGIMEFPVAGFNYRLTDFQAALVLNQFKRLNNQLQIKQEMANRYLNQLDTNKYELPVVRSNTTHSWQTFHILVKGNRANLINHLKQNNIGSNYGAQCMPHMQYFKNKYQHNSEIEFPNAYNAYTQGLALPLYVNLTDQQQQHIIHILNHYHAE